MAAWGHQGPGVRGGARPSRRWYRPLESCKLRLRAPVAIQQQLLLVMERSQRCLRAVELQRGAVPCTWTVLCPAPAPRAAARARAAAGSGDEQSPQCPSSVRDQCCSWGALGRPGSALLSDWGSLCGPSTGESFGNRNACRDRELWNWRYSDGG